MKELVFIISLLSLVGLANAQLPSKKTGKLVGQVIDDSNKKPVEYATVALLNLADSSLSGSITDAEGRFEITEIRAGIYDCKISFIGYKTYVLPQVTFLQAGLTAQNMGVITLERSDMLIEEVEIIAEREIMEMSLDKKVFNVDKNITATGGSLIDVLQNIPSVGVDINGNINLRGSSNIHILVDGKPSSLTGASRQAILEQIPANTIERIEIITSPSAKYDAEGVAGIINIITKKNTLKGLSALLNTSLGTRDKYNASALLNYQKGKLKASANYAFRYDPRWRTGNTARETFYFHQPNSIDSSLYLNQIFDGWQAITTHFFRFEASYAVQEKSELSFSFTQNFGIWERDENILQDFLGNAGLSYTRNNRNRYDYSDEPRQDIGLDYSKEFKQKGQKLSLSLRYSNSAENDVGEFREEYLDGNNEPLGNIPGLLQQSITDVLAEVFTIKADYATPFKQNNKLEFGYKSTFRNIGNDFSFFVFDEVRNAFISDDLLTNLFNYQEDVHAVYGNYTQKSGAVSFQLGLRAEQTFTQSALVLSQENFENNYLNLFPSGYINYKLNEKDEFRLGYSRRIYRPRTNQLNPFRYISDAQNLSEGNPFLLPEFVDSYELSYARNWEKITLNTTFYWRERHGVIRDFREVLPGQIVLRRLLNFSGGRDYGLETVLNGKIKKWWGFMLSTNLFMNVINGENIDASLYNEAFVYAFKINTSFDLPKGVKIQLNSSYRGATISSQGGTDAYYVSDFAIQKKVLNNRGTLNLRISDIFNTLKFTFRQEAIFTEQGTGFAQESNRKRESRIAYLNFSYRFGE